MASITIDIDLPDGVEITGYERHAQGHGFEVTWPWPERCCCQRCGHEDQAFLEQKGKARVVRHLDVWNQPSFWIYEGVFHRCPHCHHRQDLVPPFKRKDASYTFAFEEHVVRLLIGSTEEEVARRLGISAETVGRIVKNQVQDAKTIDPARVILDVGMDEISLKKRHKLYVTVLTDLTDPERPRLLAVKPGRDEAGGRACRCLEMSDRRPTLARYAAIAWTWDCRSIMRARLCCPTPLASRTVFTWPSCGTKPSTGCEKKITRALLGRSCRGRSGRRFAR